jgi:hypothetical protein
MSQDLVAAIDPKLLWRLLRPIERPGVINTDMGWEIVARSHNFTNRLPLLSHLTQRWNRQIGFQGEQIPIVYAQPQPQETPATRSISAELGQSPSSQRTVVQAKFVASAPSTLTPNPSPIKGEGSRSGVAVASPIEGEANPTTDSVDSVGWVEATKPNKTSVLDFAIAQPNLYANRERTNPTMETSPSSQRTIVQAKFVASAPSTLTPNPSPTKGEGSRSGVAVTSSIEGEGGKSGVAVVSPIKEDLSGETIQNPIPLVRVRSQPLPASDRRISPGKKLPNIVKPIENAIFDPSNALPNLSPETIQNPKSKIPNPLETSLVFSNPHVNTESVQTELGIPNPGITRISRTEAMTQTTGLSSEVSPNIQFNEKSNIHPNKPDEFNVQNLIDLEALTDKIERKLMQRLIVESERRGRTIWS